MVSNEILKNNSSSTTTNQTKRLTRSQLEKQSRLKALYEESFNSSADPASSRSNSEDTNSSTNSEGGSSSIETESGGAADNNSSSSSKQRLTRSSLRVIAKENVNKNRLSCDLSVDSIMSPISLKAENGGDNGHDDSTNNINPSSGERSNDNDEVAKSAVTPSPKPPTTPVTFTPEQRSAYPLTGITEPGPNDCLFGRGGGTNHHPGNKSYRSLVESRKELYLKSKRLDKPLVAMGIISDWRGLAPPGRFLKQDDRTKFWNDVGDKKAREKTSQALREKTPVKTREGDSGSGSGNGGGREDDRREGDYRRTARFEPGVSSPVGRHVKRSSLARDHSLGTEIVGSNELNLEGFSWDDSDRPVVRNENAHVSPSAGGGGKYGGQRYASSHSHHRYPPQHQYGEYQQQHPPPQQQQQPAYPYVREHSLSNNPLSEASTSHAAPPSTFGEHPPSSSYYGHQYPPPSGYGPPPPPPPPGHHQAYHPHPQYSQHDPYYSQHHPQQRSREHSLQMNPLKGASTSQPARDFNDEESHASYDTSSRMPPLPSPTYDRGPPPPPYYGYGASPQHGQGWPTPPPGHPAGSHSHAPHEHISPSHHHDPHAPPPPLAPSPQFTYRNGSNPSAFGRYNSSNSGDGRSNSLRSLGSSVDAFYDRRDSAASSGRRDSAASSVAGAASSGASVGGAASVSGGGSVMEENADNVTPPKSASPITENPASAGTSMDYSKIAELIRESSDKSSSTTLERSTSWDEGAVANKGSGHEDTILRSQSLPYEESAGMGGSAVGGSPRAMDEMAVVNEEESTAILQKEKPSLIRKLSGGAMSRPNVFPNPTLTSTPPNGILRSNPINGVHRPEPVKRDTSNQPETLETKRSIKRVVLSRDQSAVSRRLKEQQGLGSSGAYMNNNGGGARVSSRLTKSEMLDRKLSVEINKLGLYDTYNARSLSYGVPPLDRMTTEDVLTSLIDDGDLDNSEPVAPAIGLMAPPKPMAERITTIDAIAMDIHANGDKDSSDWEGLDLIEEPEPDVAVAVPNNSGVNPDIAEKWLKGET